MRLIKEERVKNEAYGHHSGIRDCRTIDLIDIGEIGDIRLEGVPEKAIPSIPRVAFLIGTSASESLKITPGFVCVDPTASTRGHVRGFPLASRNRVLDSDSYAP